MNERAFIKVGWRLGFCEHILIQIFLLHFNGIISDIMTSKVANIRLSEEESAFIDRLVEDGYFSSRSEFIRTGVRNLIHEISKRRIYEYKKNRKEPGLTHQELLDSTKKTRKEVYREIWGE